MKNLRNLLIISLLVVLVASSLSIAAPKKIRIGFTSHFAGGKMGKDRTSLEQKRKD